MNYRVLSYLCNLSAIFLIIFGLFLNIEILNYNPIYVRSMFLFLGFLLLYLGYRFNKISKIVLKDIDQYGYFNNKVIDIDNIPIFREVPCNGDLYYAYFLIRVNNFNFKDSNILVAIILKWIKEKKILVIKGENGNILDLSNKIMFDNDFENKLFDMIYESSCDGILNIGEFNKWVKNYDMRFLALFSSMEIDIINKLMKDFHIYHRIREEDCFYTYVMDDKIYNDSIELYGFMKYLEQFSLMDSKEIKELDLWEDYIIFAALFGMTDMINKQLKKLYPDVLEIDIYNLL